jgi:hypothetical protein
MLYVLLLPLWKWNTSEQHPAVAYVLVHHRFLLFHSIQSLRIPV